MSSISKSGNSDISTISSENLLHPPQTGGSGGDRGGGGGGGGGGGVGGGVSRRSFIKSVGLTAAVSAASQAAAVTATVNHEIETDNWYQANNVKSVGPDTITVSFKLNGKPTKIATASSAMLIDVLRWDLGLTGTKPACERGACGACSVLLNGKLTASCMTMAVDAEGCEVTTIEGLATDNELDPIQTAFVKHDGLQCGFCTPGMIMATKALLTEIPKPDLNQIKEGLSGNLCRCGAYTNIFNAVLAASGQTVPVDAGSEGKGV